MHFKPVQKPIQGFEHDRKMALEVLQGEKNEWDFFSSKREEESAFLDGQITYLTKKSNDWRDEIKIKQCN